jgi:transcription elongation GreA/GreB family factor
MAEKSNQPIRLKCIYGNKVKLLNLRTNETSEYELVHYQSEKLKENKISNYTPIGKAIWAKEEGAVVSIDVAGKGLDSYRITSIENA